ncbi:MAG TPA: S8 family serine peptidase, partial [Bacteroidales bacterium]|nr:S8 family serine peptidase [Bacteroidales bacterium]
MMRNFYIPILYIFFCLLILDPVSGQQKRNMPTRQQKEKLDSLGRQFNKKFQHQKKHADSLAKLLNIPFRTITPGGTVVELQRFEHGRPVYYITHNLNSARTISTDKCWNNPAFAYTLTGENQATGIWDGGGVYLDHREFKQTEINRIIPANDLLDYSAHATHVSGTMVAAGISGEAHGMAPKATVISYDFGNDYAEMAWAAADGLTLSNHSYGPITGWYHDTGTDTWYWYGNTSVNSSEDYRFGLYDQEARDVDEICYNAPYYLIVKSAGNERNDIPPLQPFQHLDWEDDWVACSEYHEQDGGTDGFDCLCPVSGAKNILTVGAVEDIPEGYVASNDVIITDFSSWGPTDDGRIKPDLVANGIALYSALSDGEDAYGYMSGTSMSAPSVTGSVLLLNELHEKLQPGVKLRSSTIKGLLIHTADEAGVAPGPDYIYGWGLMNTMKAAEMLEANARSGGSFIVEESLEENETLTIPIEVAAGTNELKVTLCWTDPAGEPADMVLNDRTPRLVNDLDIRIEKSGDGSTFFPWVLDPEQPSNPAQKGVNSRDNVEQILINLPEEGIYQIVITHKGNLLESFQTFSLLVSGQSVPENILPPANLSATGGNNLVALSWEAPPNSTPSKYYIYRDEVLLAETTDTIYTDLTVSDYIEYAYYIKAFYNSGYLSLPTNVKSIVPAPSLGIPYNADFENDGAYWQIKSSDAGWRRGNLASLSNYYVEYEGNNGYFFGIDSYSAGKGMHVADIAITPAFNLSRCTSATLSFDYLLINGIYGAIDELKLMYKTESEKEWHELENLPASFVWISHQINLPAEMFRDRILLGFSYDDQYVWGMGAGIDNINLTGEVIPSSDLSVNNITDPVSDCQLFSNEQVRVEIQNNGPVTLSAGQQVAMQLAVDGNILANEQFTLQQGISPDDIFYYIFQTAVDLSEDRDYTIRVSAISDNDPNPDNNSLTKRVTNYGFSEVSILNLEDSYCKDAEPVLLTGDPEGGQFTGTGIAGNIFYPSSIDDPTTDITYTYTDENSCISAITKSVLIQELPVTEITASATTSCMGDTIDLSGEPSGGIFYGTGVEEDLFIPAVAGEGEHKVYYDYTDEEGCFAADSLTITVYGVPEITFEIQLEEICSSASPVPLEALPSGGVFSGPGVTGDSFDPALAGEGAHLITYVYTTLNVCVDSVSDIITVLSEMPVELITESQEICIGEEPFEIEVYPANAMLSGDGLQENLFYPAQAGEGDHLIIAENSEALCSVSDSIVISVKPLPEVSIVSLPGSICQNSDSVILSGTPAEGTFSGEGVFDGIFYPSMVDPGTTTIIYVYESSYGCIASDTAIIEITKIPDLKFLNLPDQICMNESSFNLLAEPSGGVFTGAGVTEGLFDPATAGSGIHIIEYFFTSAEGCNTSVTDSITVIRSVPVTFLTTAQTLCLEAAPVSLPVSPAETQVSGPGVLDNIFYPDLAGTGEHILTAEISDNVCVSVDSLQIIVVSETQPEIGKLPDLICENDEGIELSAVPEGGIFSGSSVIDGVFYPSQAGTGEQQIYYTYEDVNGCTGSDTALVSVHSSADIIITVPDNPVCANTDPFTLEAIPAGGIFSGTGMIGNVFEPEGEGI